jgi:hypothetical protein
MQLWPFSLRTVRVLTYVMQVCLVVMLLVDARLLYSDAANDDLITFALRGFNIAVLIYLFVWQARIRARAR